MRLSDSIIDNQLKTGGIITRQGWTTGDVIFLRPGSEISADALGNVVSIPNRVKSMLLSSQHTWFEFTEFYCGFNIIHNKIINGYQLTDEDKEADDWVLM